MKLILGVCLGPNLDALGVKFLNRYVWCYRSKLGGQIAAFGSCVFSMNLPMLIVFCWLNWTLSGITITKIEELHHLWKHLWPLVQHVFCHCCAVFVALLIIMMGKLAGFSVNSQCVPQSAIRFNTPCASWLAGQVTSVVWQANRKWTFSTLDLLPLTPPPEFELKWQWKSMFLS